MRPKPRPAQLIQALLIAVGFAGAAWALVLLWMALAAGLALGLLVAAAGGQGARVPWWMESGPTGSAMVLVFGAQLALTSVAVRRTAWPDRAPSGYVPGLLLAVLLGPLPLGSIIWSQHRTAERRAAERTERLAQERAEDEARAEQERATDEARQQRAEQDRLRSEEQQDAERTKQQVAVQRVEDEARSERARLRRRR